MTDNLTHLQLTLRIPAPHLTADEYHDRAEQIMAALLDAEQANPGLVVDPGVAAQAGPERLVDVTCSVRIEDGAMWTEVPGLPGCFAAGQTVDELRECLAEAVKLYFAETTEG